MKYVLVATLIMIAGIFFFLQLHGQVRLLTDKGTIVLADFTNATGDGVFDETLRQGLTIQLTESPFLSVISKDSVRRFVRFKH